MSERRIFRFEYGFDDDPGASGAATSFGDYLADWLACGGSWFSPARQPEGWRLDEQLRRAGIFWIQTDDE